MLIYKLEYYGTNEVLGLGLIGNIQLLIGLFGYYTNDINYIDMYSNGKCIVYDEEYEKDTRILNPLLYYFDFECDLNSKKNSKIISYPLTEIRNLIYLKYANYDIKYKSIYNNIKNNFFKYYNFKSDILEVVNNFNNMYFSNDDNILGLHLRTTDMMHTNQNKNINYFRDKLELALSENSLIKTIFIASDNNGVIKYFVDLYPNKNIVFLDIISRESDIYSKVAPHHRININNKIVNNRKYHNYLTGKEAICDMLLLSKCNYLIRSFSAISDLAIFFSDSIIKTYS